MKLKEGYDRQISYIMDDPRAEYKDPRNFEITSSTLLSLGGSRKVLKMH